MRRLEKERWVQSKIFEKRGKLGEEKRKDWEQFLQLDKIERELRIETSEAKENLWSDEKKMKRKKEIMRMKFTIQRGKLMEKGWRNLIQ